MGMPNSDDVVKLDASCMLEQAHANKGDGPARAPMNLESDKIGEKWPGLLQCDVRLRCDIGFASASRV